MILVWLVCLPFRKQDYMRHANSVKKLRQLWLDIIPRRTLYTSCCPATCHSQSSDVSEWFVWRVARWSLLCVFFLREGVYLKIIPVNTKIKVVFLQYLMGLCWSSTPHTDTINSPVLPGFMGGGGALLAWRLSTNIITLAVGGLVRKGRVWGRAGWLTLWPSVVVIVVVYGRHFICCLRIVFRCD